MIAVAVVAILAALVVPSWMGETRKSKARSEVSAMFAELSSKEMQYKVDNVGYLQSAACPSGSPSSTARDATPCVNAASGVWMPMRVLLPETTVYCTYEITTGTGSEVPSPPVGFTMTAPAVSWFFIVATCNMKGGATNATYFTSSVDTTIQAQNEGS
jgi:type II secretory pathway pseudopilin PulG